MKENNKSEVVRLTDNDQINRLLNNLVRDVKGFTESQLELIGRLTKVGAALSPEDLLEHNPSDPATQISISFMVVPY